MGVVYIAYDEALSREVAIKILQDKYAPDSAMAVRFLEEATITGQLQHPGVPAVYQVGRLADGRPFLAMKLIKGDTLDRLLKANAPVDCLAVFEGISQAVGYAHEHGVIHRDLKPSNVMVGRFGETQVMDWGLAKVLAQRPEVPASDPNISSQSRINLVRDSDTPFTQHGSAMGTPGYMPPEQAAGELAKVDRRSDVFGLGAVLCVILTGEPPFDGRDNESVRLNAIRGKTENAITRLDECGADPEIVALCKRCLAVNPEDRPASANEVAATVASLRRAAADRAKLAELDKAKAEVRAAEQAKRRRAVQWAAGVVATVLLIGVAGTTAGLIQADAAGREAEARRVQAEAAQKVAVNKEAEANAVVKFFEDHVFAAARPKGQAGGLGKDLGLRDALVASLPALATEFTDQPEVEARLRQSLGLTLVFLSDYQTAAEQFEQARAIFTQLRGPEHTDTLQCTTNLANSYAALGRDPEALKLREATLAAYKRVLPPDHPDILKCKSNLAVSYTNLGRHSQARELLEETFAAHKRVLPPDHPDTLKSMANLAYAYAALDRHADALKLREETLAVYKRILPLDHPSTLRSQHELAESYHAVRRFREALSLNEETLDARRRVLPPDHSDILATMTNLANCYSALNRHQSALKLREETLAAYKRSLPADHPDTLVSAYNLANSYEALHRHADALKLREETLAARQRVLPPDHPNTLASMSKLADSYEDLDRAADALKLREETLAGCRRAFPPDHTNTQKTMFNLALSYSAANRHAEALKLREELLVIRKRVLPPNDGDTLVTMCAVADSLVKLQRGTEAVPLIDECISKSGGKVVDPRAFATIISGLMRHFQQSSDPAGCRAAAEMYEKLKLTSANGLYDAACCRAVAAAVYSKASQPAEATADADRAMVWLTKAIDAGYRDGSHMEKDDDLSVLRSRSDFQKLLTSIPVAPPAPPKSDK